MTVVAGCLLPDGALLGADCRVTCTQPDGSKIQSDTAAKITRLGPASAIGYSGDIRTVSWLYGHLYKQLPQRKLDPISIRKWMPRFLRDLYNRLAQRYQVGPVSFLTASSIQGRPTQIPKSLVWASLERSSDLGLNNWLILQLLNDIKSPGEYFEVPNSSMGILYEMKSPDFNPHDYPPLSFTAIGSGKAVDKTLDTYSILFAVEPTHRAVVWFIDALTQFLNETEKRTVGGLILVAQLQNGNVTHVGFDDAPGKRKSRVGIASKNGHFIVYASDGREVKLKFPGEIARKHLRNLIVDDLKTAIPSEIKRRKSLINKISSDVQIKKK